MTWLFLYSIQEHNSRCVYTVTLAAAPVAVAKENEKSSLSWIVNNANAATGYRGETDARKTCQLVAERLSLPNNSVQPFSTGVIGEFLPMSRVAEAVAEASSKLTPGEWERAATAIMTTDTRPKIVSSQVKIAGQLVTITGVAKGSGMIKQDMATMLAFIASDIPIERTLLKELLTEICDKSFNRITVMEIRPQMTALCWHVLVWLICPLFLVKTTLAMIKLKIFFWIMQKCLLSP